MIRIFGIRSDSEIFADYQEKFFNNFFDYCIKNKITKIIHLGDMFEKRKTININTLERWKIMFLDKIINNKMELIVIAGNHDVYHKNTNSINSLRQMLGKYSWAKIIDINPEMSRIGNHNFLFVPWITDDNAEICVKELEKNKADVVMGHFELSGFEMNKGYLMESGMDSDILKGYQMVLSGHYHTKSTKDNIYYLGTQMEFTWTDFNDKKYFHVLDTNSLKLEAIENTEYMFVKLYYDNAPLSKVLPNVKNCCVKLYVTKKENVIDYEIYVNKIKGENPHEFSIIDTTMQVTNSTTNNFTDADDTESIISSYIDAISDIADSDKIDVKNLLLKLYSEALNV